ncbi:MAG: hypothetical protein H6739_28370 [Alphaproteobacteria bacterium]|nr:hypothetical protein [Alphaproteobacteria bacterium]
MISMSWALLLTIPLSWAQDEADGERPWGTWGEVRGLFSLPPDITVDAEGHHTDQPWVLDTRARLGVGYETERLRVRLEGDVFTAQALGHPWQLERDIDIRHRDTVGLLQPHAFAPRVAAVQGLLGPVQLEAGLVTSNWGLGLLANDGNHDPFFGRADGGDTVLRVRATTLPFAKRGLPLSVTLAADQVYADDLARLVGDDQLAWQGIAALLYKDEVGRALGVYGVYRHQREPDRSRRTNAGVVDVYGDLPLTAGPLSVRIAAEAAGILGNTSRALTYNARDQLKVRSLGATGLVSVGALEDRALLHLRGGYASGDGDGADAYSRDFTFDPNFDVGMVLFDELGGALEVGAWGLLSDPEHSAQPPDGAEALVTEGSFRRATFFQPILEGRPMPWLKVRGGVVMAWSTAPIANPFYSYRNGGAPTTHLNTKWSGDYSLGTEIDWGVIVGDVELEKGRLAATPALWVQGGHALVSEDMGGGTLHLVTVLGRVQW